MRCFGIAKYVLLLAFSLLASLAAIAQAGSLDPTFGTGGIATTPNTTTGCGAVVNCAMALQSDGKIVVAGGATAMNGAPELALARYRTDGTLDSAFGSSGIVIVGENNGGPAFAVAIQPDGKIVTAGPSNLKLNIYRFNSNGTLDGSFGSGGIVSTKAAGLFIGDNPGGIAVLPSGKILVAAGGVLVQLLSNGQLDSTFGTGGAAQMISSAQAMVPAPSGGSLVVSGFTFTVGSAVRYNANGSLVTSFGVKGQTASFGEPLAITTQSDGKIIVAGTLDSGPRSSLTPQGFVLVRYNANGTIDNAFGTHGAVVTSFPGNSYAVAFAVTVQGNGDIVAAGTTAVNNPVNGAEPMDFALSRYTPAGQLDTTFGNNGVVTTAFGTNGQNLAAASAIVIQADGKIVVAGYDNSPIFNPPSNGFTLARYLAQ